MEIMKNEKHGDSGAERQPMGGGPMRRFAYVIFRVSLLFSSLCFDAGFSPAPGVGTVSEGNLPQDLRDLTIRDHYFPSPFKRVGIIHTRA